MSTKSPSKTHSFEQSLKILNEIVEKMEHGGLSLEESLVQYEKGVALVRTCQTALQTAEQKVQMLLEKNGKQALVDFNESE